MKRYRGRYTTLIAAAVCVPLLAVAQTQSLSLKHGMYVQLTYECVGAPKAATMYWDGIGFSGAPTSKCTSNLQSNDGRQFLVNTSCSALLDKSPDIAGRLDPFTLTRQSSDRFEMVKVGQRSFTYRWCGATKVETK